jgi:hypothetical protein
MTVAVSGKIAEGMRKPVDDGRDVLVSRKSGESSDGARRTNAWNFDPAGTEEGAHCLGDDNTVPQEL